MTEPDHAAQPERTRLAWRRTALAATIVLLLALRHLVVDGFGGVDIALGCALVLCWSALLLGAQARIRALATRRPHAMRAPWPALAGSIVLAISTVAIVDRLV